jgi:DNA repair protein SbcC/Rad50
MRPLRLMMDGFGSYRDRTEVDLSDVGFFALTGPTGAGKSTVIDALCFALYGTVPRWGKGNMIRNALAPSTSSCRVCLVFEASGGRYAAARVLRRDARGQVHTKEARLDRLDGAVPAGAELDRILETGVPLTEGPEQVTAEVTELLGIGYEHFTQCVLLPQGRFAEFLHAKPGQRQDLLIELLAYAVYEQVGRRARERAREAGVLLANAERQLAALGEVDQGAIEAAERRVAALDGLERQVDASVEVIGDLRAQTARLVERAAVVRQRADRLAALRMPPDTVGLAGRLAAADELIGRRRTEQARLDAAETVAEQRCAGLPERSLLVGWRDGHARTAVLSADVQVRVERCAEAEAAERECAAEVDAAERATAVAVEALAAAEQAHRAVALAADLRVGQPCPVCRRPVGEVPHHDVPADLDHARAVLDRVKQAETRARSRLAAAGRQAAAARTTLAELQRQLADVQAALAGAPPPASVDAALLARDAAEAEISGARASARAGRAAVEHAVSAREALRATEQQAWSALRAARDGFVELQAPAVEGADLAAAWRRLLDWARDEHATLTAQAGDVDAAAAAAQAATTSATTTFVALLGEHGVPVAPDSVLTRAPVALAAHRERAVHLLADLRSRRDQASALTEQIARHREQRDVAELLGERLLRSSGFEQWLCAEALDSLVFEASETLMQLSGGQYQLDRTDRSELVVIDHNDAGTSRPVNTLSGGETFQASLALALALSHQVVGLSGGKRSLDSMFLDEGFGTLDESTLDTVAATLERLAADTDRMVGIVTHVPALAERVPVQFAVTRDGASSRLRRVWV